MSHGSGAQGSNHMYVSSGSPLGPPGAPPVPPVLPAGGGGGGGGGPLPPIINEQLQALMAGIQGLQTGQVNARDDAEKTKSDIRAEMETMRKNIQVTITQGQLGI